jgi:hypothetical protein
MRAAVVSSTDPVSPPGITPMGTARVTGLMQFLDSSIRPCPQQIYRARSRLDPGERAIQFPGRLPDHRTVRPDSWRLRWFA